jgi:hypothetical protein
MEELVNTPGHHAFRDVNIRSRERFHFSPSYYHVIKNIFVHHDYHDISEYDPFAP